MPLVFSMFSIKQLCWSVTFFSLITCMSVLPLFPHSAALINTNDTLCVLFVNYFTCSIHKYTVLCYLVIEYKACRNCRTLYCWDATKIYCEGSSDAVAFIVLLPWVMNGLKIEQMYCIFSWVLVRTVQMCKQCWLTGKANAGYNFSHTCSYCQP